MKTRGSQPFSLIEKKQTVPVAIWYRIIATNIMVMFLRVKIDLTCGGGGEGYNITKTAMIDFIILN